MDAPEKTRRLERNVRLYPWYVAAFHAMFWLPVFFLYFRQHLALEQVLRLEAVYYIAVVLLEIPSGYFSDAFGRRISLLVSALGLLAAYALFWVGGTLSPAGPAPSAANEPPVPVFVVFAAAQVCFAVGMAFRSGSDVSFHYDSLASLGRQAEFGGREAVASRNNFLATALAALAGGCAGALALRWAYALSFCSAAIVLMLVIRFVEPTTHERGTVWEQGFARQIRTCIGYLRDRALLWLFAFVVLMIVINHIPYEFYQPYIKLVAAGSRVPDTGTPVAAGIHTSLTMLLGALVAARSIRVRDALGLGPTLLSAAGLQLIVIAAMGLVLHPLIVLLALARSCPRALMTAPINAAVAPRVPQQQRATYLSLVSLGGRLAFGGALVLLSLLTFGRQTDWQRISFLLCVSAAAGLVPLALLVLSVRALNVGKRERGNV